MLRLCLWGANILMIHSSLRFKNIHESNQVSKQVRRHKMSYVTSLLNASLTYSTCTPRCTSLFLNHACSSPHISPPVTPPHFSSFVPVTMDEISILLSDSSETNCDLDPIPTSLLEHCSSVLLPTITNIINLSLSTIAFSRISSRIVQFILISRSLVLINENLANYRPISHLSYLSKLTERIVKTRLTEHSSNNKTKPFQSAYIEGHSTETLYCLSMTTSSKLWVFSKLLVSLSLTNLLLLTPLITPSYSNVYHLGLESLRMLCLG